MNPWNEFGGRPGHPGLGLYFDLFDEEPSNAGTGFARYYGRSDTGRAYEKRGSTARSYAFEQQANIFTLLNRFKDVELDDQDGTPIAPRRIRTIDALIRATDNANVEGRYISKASIETLAGGDPVGSSRQILTAGGLQGGGDLSADRTLSIADNGVTDLKLRDSAGTSVIGKATAGAGDPGDIAAAADDTVLRRTAGALNFGGLALGMAAANLWPFSKLQQVTGPTVVGKSAAGAGDMAEIAAAANDQFLVRRAGALAFGGLLDSDIPATIARDSEVTAAITAHEGAGDPHPGYQQESEKGNANGYAPLDTDAFVPEAHMPEPRGPRGWTVFEEFLQGTIVIAAPGHNSKEGWVRIVSGTGATMSKQAGTADHPGIWQLNAGTLTNSRAHIHLDINAIRLSGGRIKYECMINLPTAPDGTTDFRVFCGFAGAVGAGDPANAVGFMIDRAVSAANWLKFTSKGAVKNKNSTGIAFGAGWVKLEFIINAAATNVDFLVGGASGGSENTNIPLAGGEEIGFIFSIEKVSSTNDRTMQIDYVRARQWLTTPR